MTERWSGIYKVIQKCSEVSALLAKLAAFPDGQYPNGQDLRTDTKREIGALLASLDFFVDLNGLEDDSVIQDELHRKRSQYYQRNLAGVFVDNDPL